MWPQVPQDAHDTIRGINSATSRLRVSSCTNHHFHLQQCCPSGGKFVETICSSFCNWACQSKEGQTEGNTLRRSRLLHIQIFRQARSVSLHLSEQLIILLGLGHSKEGYVLHGIVMLVFTSPEISSNTDTEHFRGYAEGQ